VSRAAVRRRPSTQSTRRNNMTSLGHRQPVAAVCIVVFVGLYWRFRQTVTVHRGFEYVAAFRRGVGVRRHFGLFFLVRSVFRDG
jgi:hypothetical protein